MIQVEPDRESFERVIHALDDEADGRELMHDLAAGLDAALKPAVGEVRQTLMGAAHGGLPHAGEPLRPAVAAAVGTDVSVSARSVRASLLARKTGMPRNFANAPKRLNQRQFRRRVFGRAWTTQIGAPGWFDEPTQRHRPQYEQEAQRALQNVADRIARKA